MDGGAADATGGGVDEQGLAGPEGGAAVEAEPGGLVADVEGGGFGVVEGVGGGEGAGGVHQGVLGEGAGGDDGGAEDAGPGAVAGGDLAAEFDAGGERKRRADLVVAADHQRVGEVDGGGADLDEELAGAGDGHGGVVDESQDVLGLAEFGGLPGPHAVASRASTVCWSLFMPASHRSGVVARAA
ncbi:hypothetical protein GCM10010441_41510 [Kitasatospora paracochleata]